METQDKDQDDNKTVSKEPTAAEKAAAEKRLAISKMPLVQVKTIAPIPSDTLRRMFNENIEYVVDYTDSRFKGKVFITYLANTEIRARVQLRNVDDALELLVAYLHHPSLAVLPELEDIAMNMMLAYQGKPHFLSFDPEDFIEKNRAILATWHKRICQLPVFALFCRGGEYEQQACTYPLDEDSTMTGINFVKLIDHPMFSILIDGVRKEDMSHNPTLFTKYFFKGENLFKFFANPNNPLFIATLSSPEDLNKMIQAGLEELSELQQHLGESNVPSL